MKKFIDSLRQADTIVLHTCVTCDRESMPTEVLDAVLVEASRRLNEAMLHGQEKDLLMEILLPSRQ